MYKMTFLNVTHPRPIYQGDLLRASPLFYVMVHYESGSHRRTAAQRREFERVERDFVS